MSPSKASASKSYINLKCSLLLSGMPNGISALGSFTDRLIAMLMRRSSSRMFSV